MSVSAGQLPGHGISSRLLSRRPSRLPSYAHIPEIIAQQALGLKKPLGATDTLASTIYNSYEVIKSSMGSTFNYYRGGIFNLEFSLNGRLLAAACEAKQVLLHDSGNQKRVAVIENAHENCVNCIKFLTDNTFATASDDSLVKLWDLRNLGTSLKTLYGHTNWVKNIEWSEQEQVMVTSSFDGNIYAWNLKEPTENNMLFDKVFLMKGMMRMKLTPDSRSMIISTSAGYLIIVHHLNLLTLATDLRSFRPEVYRLMQDSHQVFPVAISYNSLFSPSRKQNRIEFIDDFPNDAGAICSLQIHPHGWSAVTRNVNNFVDEEWTAVHDIQQRDDKQYEEAYEYVDEMNIFDDPQIPTERAARPSDLWMGSISLEEHMSSAEIEFNPWRSRHEEMAEIMNSGIIGMNPCNEAYFKQHPKEQNKIVKNLSRLTHFLKEKNVGVNYIKELSFSPDGRVICSPYDKGVRLLAFNEKCQELSECVPESPKELHTILEMDNYHRDIVVSCKFSPTYNQLVTGCLGSEIKWFQPVL